LQNTATQLSLVESELRAVKVGCLTEFPCYCKLDLCEFGDIIYMRNLDLCFILTVRHFLVRGFPKESSTRCAVDRRQLNIYCYRCPKWEAECIRHFSESVDVTDVFHKPVGIPPVFWPSASAYSNCLMDQSQHGQQQAFSGVTVVCISVRPSVKQHNRSSANSSLRLPV